MTMADRLCPSELSEFGGDAEGAVTLSGQWVHTNPPEGGGRTGYLGGSGGICSSVGEVSMIRTSSRSM